MQALEDFENLPMVFGWDTNAVIVHRQDGFSIPGLPCDGYLGRCVRFVIGDGVVQQVGEDLG